MKKVEVEFVMYTGEGDKRDSEKGIYDPQYKVIPFLEADLLAGCWRHFYLKESFKKKELIELYAYNDNVLYEDRHIHFLKSSFNISFDKNNEYVVYHSWNLINSIEDLYRKNKERTFIELLLILPKEKENLIVTGILKKYKSNGIKLVEI